MLIKHLVNEVMDKPVECCGLHSYATSALQHVCRLSNTHNLGSFIPTGPRLFLSCPMDVEGSRVWFTDLWNYSLVPYLLEAVREGLQVCSS